MSNRAWVTLATNDSYGLGALVLAYSLRRVGSRYPAVVLLTPAVTEAMRDRLRGVFAEVVLVDVLDSRDAAHLALLQRPELGITFTKIHCWTLTQYEKCVFLDADTLVVQNCDELFDREELSAAPDVGWPDCFNSGVFVYKPSNETFEALVRFAQERGSFDGGDQGLLNSYFSEWARGDPSKRLPFLYNVTSAAFYSYIPALKQFGQNMKIIHFIGANKPWLQTFNWDTRSVSAPDHLRELLQLWWDLFVSQVHSHLDTSMSGVAGNLARVSPDNIGSQSEVLDELTRRQGWEAGNIDYMGADSFANIWAKISQTLSQPRSSPPKQATPPPKEPTPPKQPTPPKDLTSLSEVEPIQPERTEQSAVTPIQKEVGSPVPAPITETVVQAISELETALKDESKFSTESPIIDPAKPEDKLEPEAFKPPVTETVVQAISELETALKDESKVSTESLITDPAKPAEKLAMLAIKPALESKVESDIKKATVAVEPEITKPDVIALDFPPDFGSEIISEKLIAAETISKSLAEPTPSADHQPENASKLETGIVQLESSAADASVSVSETSEPSKITPIPLKSLADTKLEQAESGSTQVAQLKGESSLQSVEDATEISQAKAPVESRADTEILQAKAPVESPADTAVSQVKAPVGSPADIPLSPAPATESPTVVSADIEVSSTRETPVTTEVSDTVVTSAKEISASTEISAKTQTSTMTDIPALKKSSTIIDQVPATTGPTVTEAPVMAETSATTEALTPKEAPTITEVPAKSETLPTDVATTTETPPAADVSTTLESSVETETSVKPEVLATPEALASIPAVTDIPTELPAAKEAPVKVAKSVEGSTCSVSHEAKKAPSTPDKSLELSKDSASDSPPLATTPAKEEQPPTVVKSGAGAAAEGDRERAARRPAQRLQLVPPVAAAAPLTPDSEIEDAAALAQSIIASELATPTVTAPTPPLPTPASPPAPPVSLAQIGVKPTAKEKTTTAAHIASSVSETKDIGAPKKKSEKPAPAKPEQHAEPSEQPTPSSPTDTTEPAAATPKEEPVKKKVIKKVKKEGSTAETPVPPPRKKEKKPK